MKLPKRPKEQIDGTVRYNTGAMRSVDRERVRYDLISPIGLRRLAQACHEGAELYSDYNWEAGMPVADLLNHAIAHLYDYLAGDREEDHLAHAVWNCVAACHSEELWPQLNENLRSKGCRAPGSVSLPERAAHAAVEQESL